MRVPYFFAIYCDVLNRKKLIACPILLMLLTMLHLLLSLEATHEVSKSAFMLVGVVSLHHQASCQNMTIVAAASVIFLMLPISRSPVENFPWSTTYQQVGKICITFTNTEQRRVLFLPCVKNKMIGHHQSTRL